MQVKCCCCCCCLITSVVSDSVRPHRQQPTRLPRPWDSPGKNTGVGCHFLLQSMKVKSESEVAQSYLTLSDPMDCSLPGSSIHGIFQARVLEWGAIAFSEKYTRNIKRTCKYLLSKISLMIWEWLDIFSIWSVAMKHTFSIPQCPFERDKLIHFISDIVLPMARLVRVAIRD